jgi:ADP-heptose:LPS heptosyltransferase
MIIHTDCRYYKGSMPCRFHKVDGRPCEGCADYSQVTTRILMVKLAAVGDVLRTTSVLPALRLKYPGAHITWITKRNAAPLLTNNPLVDRVLLVEENFLEFLQNEKFDIGICLDSDPHSATIHAVAHCTLKFGFVTNTSGAVELANEAAREWWLMGVNDRKKKENRRTYQQIMYEICDLPLPVQKPQLYLSGPMERFGKEFIEKRGLAGTRQFIGINTGGGGRWQHKKWTFEGYVETIRLLRQRHPKCTILLFGGPEEVELNRQILDTVGDLVVDTGCNNSLMEFASLVNIVDILLTSDSLAMHMGVALGKATIVLVGPTSPWELDVFGRGEIMHSDIECLVCYLSRCDKTVTCMNTLPAGRVLQKIEEFLA